MMADLSSHQEKNLCAKTKREAMAVEDLKDHVYTCLASNDDVQVWHCGRPKSSVYAFDIMVTRYGIAVVGDIGNLTFSVGLSYGIEFLAGSDLGYYIHSKLDEKCKVRQLDENAFRCQLVEGVCSVIRKEATYNPTLQLPDWMEEDANGIAYAAHWDEIIQYLEDRYREDGLDDIWNALLSRLQEAVSISHLDEARTFMADNYTVLGLGEEWWDSRIDEASESLMVDLFMINQAAKKILKQIGAT